MKELTLGEVEFVAAGVDCSWRGYGSAFVGGGISGGIAGSFFGPGILPGAGVGAIGGGLGAIGQYTWQCM